jgi:membrane protease YdiL (CAAX protease family)
MGSFPSRRTSGEPRRASPAGRQAALFVALSWAQTLGLALALPHAGIAPLLAIATPLISTALVITFGTPAGHRRAAWAGVGFGLPPWWGPVVAVVVTAAVTVASFAAAAAVGVARFPDLDLAPAVLGPAAANLAVAILIFTVVFLGEEIGWRGYLLPRLMELMSGRRASIVTGACHAIFHLPLLVLTTTYQSAGNRWIVVPMVLGTLTLAGVVYGWLRLTTGSIWPVCLAHSAFNNFMETAGAVAVATSPAALAYLTTETGVFTLLLMIGIAAWLLTARAADFEASRTSAAGRGSRSASRHIR